MRNLHTRNDQQQKGTSDSKHARTKNTDDSRNIDMKKERLLRNKDMQEQRHIKEGNEKQTTIKQRHETKQNI